MNAIEQGIQEALAELDAAVRAMGAAHPKPDLQALFARLDELTSRLPPGSDPNLIHYLRNKSYDKARRWLRQKCDE